MKAANDNVRFKTKKARTEHYRAILNESQLNVPLAEYHSDMMELIATHPNVEEKIGVGVESFMVTNMPVYGSRCFVINRVDGTTIDFSYIACIRGESSHKSKVTAAFRYAVSGQILAFKRLAFANDNARCAISGNSVGYDDVDVDHTPPDTFARIMSDFLTDRGITVDDVGVKENDNRVTHGLVNSELEAAWTEFHRSRARLRVLAKTSHKRAHANDNTKKKAVA